MGPAGVVRRDLGEGYLFGVVVRVGFAAVAGGADLALRGAGVDEVAAAVRADVFASLHVRAEDRQPRYVVPCERIRGQGGFSRRTTGSQRGTIKRRDRGPFIAEQNVQPLAVAAGNTWHDRSGEDLPQLGNHLLERSEPVDPARVEMRRSLHVMASVPRPARAQPQPASTYR